MSLENWYQEFPAKSKFDISLFTIALGLIIFGLLMIMSSSNIIGFKLYNDSFYFAKKHVFFIILGSIFFIIGLVVPHKVWRGYSLHLWLASLFLVFLTYMPHVGSIAGGSSRWIVVAGFRFQPSDVLKFTLILLIADFLDVNKDDIKNFKRILLTIGAFVGISVLLVIRQPDLGTSVVLAFVSLVLLFVSGFPMLFMLLLIPASIGGVIISILHNPYQLKRVIAFIDPWADPLGKGFHVIQSLIAVGTGGLFGLGLGQSRQKFFYLPQQYTDFIFSIIAEELGFIFTSIFLFIFFLYIFRSFLIASKVNDLFSKLLCIGIASWIGFQGAINICVAVNLAPTKGITLPFISFGGTSLIMVMFATGVILNISRYRESHE